MKAEEYLLVGGEEPVLISASGTEQNLPKGCYMIYPNKECVISSLKSSEDESVNIANTKGFANKDFSDMIIPYFVKSYLQEQETKYFFTKATVTAGSFWAYCK